MARAQYLDWLNDDALLQIEGWARQGLENRQIAKNMGINPSTFSRWITKYNQIDQALKRGRRPLDVEIENALIKKALGYTEDEETRITRELPNGSVVREKKVVHKIFPPDNGALTFYLRNRSNLSYSNNPKTPEEIESIKLDNELKRIELENRRSISSLSNDFNFNGIPAGAFSPAFAPIYHDIINKGHAEYVFKGGRGSGKSSFISLILIQELINNPNIHAVVSMGVAERLKTSVYNQVLWAIDMLNLNSEFETKLSPLMITFKRTGQHIYFRGANDPMAFKSIKPEFGHIGILWFEELDLFKGAEAIRSIEQSVIRGGEECYIFKSFNPPKSKINWANKYVQTNDPKMYVSSSTYLEVPEKWLGRPFIERAEFLKEHNPEAYKNEYLGEANGSGGNVLPNIVECEIKDEDLDRFDDIVNGIDFGWTHPQAFIRAQYFPNKQELYVLAEAGGSMVTNDEFAEQIKALGVTKEDLIRCDSEEPKSVYRLQDLGLNAVKAKKGPNSRNFGYKWLASQIKIYVDPKRTPRFYEQAISLEYERDSSGEVTSNIPKINDDWLDALRYACEPYSRRHYDPFD